MASRAQSGDAGGRPADVGDDLAHRAAAGDQDAIDRVLQAMQGTIARLAGERAAGPLPVEDLIQEGSVGLIAAIGAYGSQDGGFKARAEESIARQMDAAIAEETALRESDAAMVRHAEEYERTWLSLRRELEREPSTLELATKLEWPVDQVELVARAVAAARLAHDEEILGYVDPGAIDAGDLLGEEPDDERT